MGIRIIVVYDGYISVTAYAFPHEFGALCYFGLGTSCLECRRFPDSIYSCRFENGEIPSRRNCYGLNLSVRLNLVGKLQSKWHYKLSGNRKGHLSFITNSSKID